ncbi:MAG: hypothetical protein AAF153_01505 [Pseudomonadota bacterium]
MSEEEAKGVDIAISSDQLVEYTLGDYTAKVTAEQRDFLEQSITTDINNVSDDKVHYEVYEPAKDYVSMLLRGEVDELATEIYSQNTSKDVIGGMIFTPSGEYNKKLRSLRSELCKKISERVNGAEIEKSFADDETIRTQPGDTNRSQPSGQQP